MSVNDCCLRIEITKMFWIGQENMELSLVHFVDCSKVTPIVALHI